MIDVAAAADRLWEAIRTRRSIAPLTDEHPGLTVDDAYEIQDAVVARYADSGAPVTALKLGLTSRAKQTQMGVDEPLYGWLTASMALDVGEELDTDALIQPRAEPEIAFLIGRDLDDPATTAADVLAATTAVAPAVDVLDSRFAGYRFTLPDVAADNSSAGRYLVGGRLSPPDVLDLRVLGCAFWKNGELVATATGAASLDHPAAAVAWAVRKLASRGQGLAAGRWVLSGALTAAVPLAAGDHVLVEFDRIGSVGLRAR
ncbi:MAG TPA: 4-oxalocrotonate decarboxylase [Actinobacteria bacterium]|nr:4-oxalocrotonate decarboxylase [Actinomycetota bacterium]